MSGASDGLVLTCKPGVEDGAMLFAYTLTNHGAAPLFVIDGLTEFDPNANEGKGGLRAAPDYALLWQAPDGDAVIARSLPPPPEGAQVVAAAVVLVARLAPGEAIERVLRVKLPLAEANPYFGELTLREYALVPVAGVRFAVGYWVAAGEGVAVAPAPFAPGLMMAGSQGMAAVLRHVSQHFPVSKLELFRRTDAFPRPELAWQGQPPPPPAGRG